MVSRCESLTVSDAEHLCLCPRPGSVYFSAINSLVIILTCLSAGFFTVCNFKVVYLWIVSAWFQKFTRTFFSNATNWLCVARVLRVCMNVCVFLGSAYV